MSDFEHRTDLNARGRMMAARRIDSEATVWRMTGRMGFLGRWRRGADRDKRY